MRKSWVAVSPYPAQSDPLHIMQAPVNLSVTGLFFSAKIAYRQPQEQHQAHVVIIHKRFKTGVTLTLCDQLLLINKQQPATSTDQ